MRLTQVEARSRFVGARSARMSTVNDDGSPHLLPVVFALVDNEVVHVIDGKPKATDDPYELRRVRNVRREPRMSFLVDVYDDDWAQLWWVRADGVGRVVDPGGDGWAEAVDALAERYQNYRADRPNGPVIAAEILRWSGWSAS